MATVASANRTLVHICLVAAFIAVLGLVPRIDVPIAAGVPITAQTLGVMLAGLLLGARNGALAVLLFLFVVSIGMPFLAGGRGGPGVLLGPTGGYLVGWVAGALVTGWLFSTIGLKNRFLRALIAALFGCIPVIYAFGIPWLSFMGKLPLETAALASAVFIPGDIIKAVLAALILVSLPADLGARRT